MAKKVEVSIIIPCFNEERRLPQGFPEAYDFFKKNLDSFEIILVNDGSLDKTEGVLKQLEKKYPHASVISYQLNQGKGYALMEGLEKAQGQIVGFIDADFAISLGEIPVFIKTVKDGADIVIGDRSSKGSRNITKLSLPRKFLGKTLAFVNNFLLDLGAIKDTQCGFKFFKRDIAKKLFAKLTIYRWLWDVEILLTARKKNFKIIQLPVSWQQRDQSKVNLFRDLFPVSIDLLKIYLKFMSLRIFLVVTMVLTIVMMMPFLLNSWTLTQRNGDFSDLVWPDYYFIKESILKFQQVPFWNPTLFSGIPEITNPQSPIIYPPNILALILPLDLAIILLILSHTWMAGIFLYLLAKKIFHWSNLASLVFSFCFIFSPFIWGKFAVGHLSQSFAILLLAPILFFGAQLFLKPKLADFLVLSIFLSLQYLNYPTVWYFTVIFGELTLGYFSLLKKQLTSLIYISLASIISLVLIVPVFLLQLQAGPLITRSTFSLADLSIPFWGIRRFLAGSLIPSNLLRDYDTEVWLYPSLGVITVAFWSFFKIDRKLRFLAGLILGLVILITLGNRTPLFAFLVKYLPMFSYMRVSTRDWFILIITIAFLAGWGVNKMRDHRQKIIMALVIADLLLFSILRLWFVPEVMQAYKNSNITPLLTEKDNLYRYYCTSRCISAHFSTPLDINTADGYHLIILKHYRDKISDAGGFAPPKYTGNIPGVDEFDAQPSAAELGSFAVKWVISKNELTDENFVKVKENNGYTLYQNMFALPRVRFKTTTDNFAKLLVDTPNYLKIGTEGKADRLILADTYYPGWEVWVDNQKDEIELEDSWARAVDLPAGSHLVEFKFKPFHYLLEGII